MRILLSLLLLFGCGEDGDVDQQSEGGSSDQQSEFDSYESVACEPTEVNSQRVEYLASIELLHPVEVLLVVICRIDREELDGRIVEGDKVCRPSLMYYNLLDGPVTVSCHVTNLDSSYEVDRDREVELVVYYKKL